MRLEILAFITAVASASAQTVVGTAYGFGIGATGGGAAAAVTPTTNDELAKFLSDDQARTILITKTFDFTGQTSTGAGCDRKSCSNANGGQLYLGDLSCGNADNVAVTSIKYDTAGTAALNVGSNKSILGVGGKGVIKGKGLTLVKDASNVIIQGIHITTINPGIVWGGDAIDMKGGNSKVWIDHCKFSLVGRMFIVSHYDGSSATLSNNEFDGVTPTSATCNDNHYWSLMFIGKNEKVTLDKNYFHDLSGRAPKLGQPGVTGYFHAVNNYFENMKGHAFDAYEGANALVEGNTFKAVNQPSTPAAAKIATFVVNAGSSCSSALGRTCLDNSVDSSSGKLAGGTSMGFLTTIGKNAVSKPLSVAEVPAHVKANAGPANLRTADATAADEEKTSVTPEAPVATPEAPVATPEAPVATPVTQLPASSSSTTTSTAVESTATGSTSGTIKIYGQCGGKSYSGPVACESGASCVEQNAWFSQCIRSSSKFRRAIRL